MLLTSSFYRRALSLQALAAMKTATSRRVYYDFADMLRTNPTGNVPYTPILPLLYGMEASLKMLREEGMQNVAARHHRWGQRRRVESQCSIGCAGGRVGGRGGRGSGSGSP